MRCLSVLLLACALKPLAAMADTGAGLIHQPAAGISRDPGSWRSAHYRDVRYALQIELLPPFERVTGTLELELTLGTTPVDWCWTGAPTAPITRCTICASTGSRSSRSLLRAITWSCPAEHLHPGANRVEMAFAAPVRSAGAALTRYRDGTDGSEYVYSLLVPADASTLFPCFDQPDLKARFTLELTVPRAVARGEQRQRARAHRGGRCCALPVRADRADQHLLVCVCRRSVRRAARRATAICACWCGARGLSARAKRPGRFSACTGKGVRWLERYFGQPYPYGKLDVVLVPEFAYGGMEHAGAIFLREDSVLFPFEPSDADRLRRAQLIFHEAAHQWFGDLVTMRWFDDLWLKEGFANLMAAKAAAALLPEYAPWNAFRALKTAAYRTDETRGTTPIWQALPQSERGEVGLRQHRLQQGAGDPAPARVLPRARTRSPPASGRSSRSTLTAPPTGAICWRPSRPRAAKASQEWARAWVTGAGVPRVTLDWQRDGAGRIARLDLHRRSPCGRCAANCCSLTETARIAFTTLRLGEAQTCSGPAGDRSAGAAVRVRQPRRLRLWLVPARPGEPRLSVAHWARCGMACCGPAVGRTCGRRCVRPDRARGLASAGVASVAGRARRHQRLRCAGSGADGVPLVPERCAARSACAPLEAVLRAGMLEAPTRSLRIHYFRAFAAMAATAAGRAGVEAAPRRRAVGAGGSH